MCGEYHFSKPITTIGRGLPPRARRIRLHHPARLKHHRTTSACAENTYDPYRNGKPPWNYLRVCGEYRFGLIVAEIPMELPPRARRILLSISFLLILLGTTSACAENTARDSNVVRRSWNYLRVRGEYFSNCFIFTDRGELPPRARRIPHAILQRATTWGTTSACAENTTPCVV